MKTVAIVGGTGAQGIPVIKALTSDSAYAVRVLTRNPNSTSAKELAALPNVSIIEGNSYDEATLIKTFTGATHVYVNPNGFAIGEKNELYWGIRMFEIAAQVGVQHFIWSSSDAGYSASGYCEKYRAGHMDGSRRVHEWMESQKTGNQGLKMIWSALTSVPYLDMLNEMLAPHVEIDKGSGEETYVFQGPYGRVPWPLILLEDLGRYARWQFDNPTLSSGQNLRISTEDISWADLAKTFTKVTGKKAVYREQTVEEYFDAYPYGDPDAKVGHSVADDGTLLSFRTNFSGWYNTYNDGLVPRDYKMLDKVLPDRVKTVEEWMRKSKYNGEKLGVLKDFSAEGGIRGETKGREKLPTQSN
ncbi:hypothetical protein GALMADRAFT_227329 [Galerina marginata CBS 339.88]|uniref:NmrA-like domain-containing protein n=1 Tax=Galerina marginata (strain CBS 339.88) TaxID=685588 RepID=A0A067T5E0_GALM3|nr:hypothetical protein GALMADRAFT_227329 [Galerina marginata CBS 339.88]